MYWVTFHLRYSDVGQWGKWQGISENVKGSTMLLKEHVRSIWRRHILFSYWKCCSGTMWILKFEATLSCYYVLALLHNLFIPPQETENVFLRFMFYLKISISILVTPRKNSGKLGFLIILFPEPFEVSIPLCISSRTRDTPTVALLLPPLGRKLVESQGHVSFIPALTELITVGNTSHSV